MQISSSYSSTSLPFTGQPSEKAIAASAAPPKPSTDRVELSHQALGSAEPEVSFSLDLRYSRASVSTEALQVQGDGDILSVAYSAQSAEITSTSLSFSMAGAEVSHLNDEVSRIGKEVKPAVKEFLAAVGLRGGWGQVNRLLRSVA